jgi:hypothetical protein
MPILDEYWKLVYRLLMPKYLCGSAPRHGKYSCLAARQILERHDHVLERRLPRWAKMPDQDLRANDAAISDHRGPKTLGVEDQTPCFIVLDQALRTQPVKH